MNRAGHIAAARARLAGVTPAPMREVGDLTAALRIKRGTLVGIACNQGRFSVTETRKEGRKSITEHLTGWQSYAECAAHMRGMAA